MGSRHRNWEGNLVSQQPPGESEPEGPSYNPPPQGEPPPQGPQPQPQYPQQQQPRYPQQPQQGYPQQPQPGYPPQQPPGYPPQPPGYPPPGYPQQPLPFGSPGGPGSQEERNWAMLCHLSSFAGFVVPILGSIGGPLVAWLMKKDQWPLVNDQGKEALNFQLSIMLYGVISFVLVFVIVGIFLILAVVIFDFVMVIIAAVEAQKGRAYRYPLCIRFVT